MMKFSLAVLAGSAAASSGFGSYPSIPQGFYGDSQHSSYKPSYSHYGGPTSPHAPKPPAPTSSYYPHDSHS